MGNRAKLLSCCARDPFFHFHSGETIGMVCYVNGIHTCQRAGIFWQKSRIWTSQQINIGTLSRELVIGVTGLSSKLRSKGWFKYQCKLVILLVLKLANVIYCF